MPKVLMGFTLVKEVAVELRKKHPENMSYFVNKILRASLLRPKKRMRSS